MEKSLLINKENDKRISPKAILSFFVTLTLCFLLVGFTVMNRNNIEKITMEQLIMEKSVKINNVISKLVYKTEAFAALAVQNDGEMENFQKIAETLIDDPAILNVIIAPNGIVNNVYPLSGNENVLGFDLFNDGETVREAVWAKESGEIVFGGPFNIVQGGQALIGRLPVWIHRPEDEEGRFWGFVNITLKYPEALEGAGLNDIENRGLCYEIWRIHPETHERQVIVQGNNGYNEKMRFIEKHIPILNADWYFRIAPVYYWYEYPETWMLAFIGLCISFLVAFVMQKNSELELVKSELEYKMTEVTILADELGRASSAKTDFLAKMSHEIRTPMNGIIGYLEIALSREKELHQETKDCLQKIKLSAAGLLEIINDILDISKIEAGKMDLEMIPFSLHEVFKVCETISSPKAMEKGLILHSCANPFIAKRFLGDPTKLRQILLNLLSNAIKFTDAGMVSFIANIKSFDKKSVTVYFEVKDSGIGMSPEQLKKVFEPFTQADSSTTRKYGGTGLGLPIVKNMIELMGGKLNVESAPGEGSKFSFALTFEMVDNTADIYEEKQEDEFARPTFRGNILVCEDNAINQQVIKAHLAKLGLDAVIVENGQLGVDLAITKMRKKEPFDLILMDIQMPVMDGLEAVKKLSELGNKTPVIAMTANVMPKDKEVYRKHGMPVCLGKPFRAHELRECLLQYLTPVETASASGNTEDKRSDGHASVINREFGIEYAANDEKLYNGLLVNFTKSNKTMFKKLNDAIDAGDIKSAHMMAHTLKKMAEMLGATRLAAAASAIENALSFGGDEATFTKAQMRTLEIELNAVLDEAKIGGISEKKML